MEKVIEKHRDFLVDRIDSDFGLLDKLLARGILTREAMHRIKLKDNTTEDKNRILLDFILKNNQANELVSALRDSGQTHLVNYLNADGANGDDWPVSESDIRRLEVNRESLIDILDTTDLCIRLFSEKVINNRQKQFISSKPTDAEKNEALLEIMTKFSLRQYKITLACLNASNQSHIADLLSEGGVVVGVHANLEGDERNVDELDDEIVTQLMKVLENSPLEKHHRLWERTQQRIIAARRGQSIVIYIHSTTHDELLQLIDMLKTDRLKEIIERVFTEMLSIGDALRVTLSWSPEEFKRAATYFAKQKLDPVLVRTIRTKVAEEEKKWISGLTILDQELFVVNNKSSEVEVYDSMAFIFSRRWSLSELNDPCDIGSCKRNKCLYIINSKGLRQSKEILRVDRNGNLIKKWSTGDDFGRGLSVTDESNVIFTVYNKNKLNEYAPDGQLIREIKLSDAGIRHPRHAIKLTNGNFVVSHESNLHRVCIVNAVGKLKKSFGGRPGPTNRQVNEPRYLSVNENGFVTVADRWNHRVLLLDSDLKFKRQILSKAHHGIEFPGKIVFDESHGRRLFLSARKMNQFNILIFQLKQIK